MSEIEEEIRRQMLAERQYGGIQTAPPPAAPPKRESTLHRWQNKGGIIGALAALVILLAKIGAPVLAVLAKLKGVLVGLKFLTFGKVLLTGGSMLLSIVLEAAAWGWAFAVGITLLIFIHECGHAIAARMRGIGWSFMLFIPFLGAMVSTKRFGKSLEEDAFIGIMGPVAGTIGGLACILIYLVSGSPFWLVLARLNFLINLFNLLPTPPLDGGWIVPLFSPKLMALGIVLLFVFGVRNPMIWILALMSIPRIIAGWRANPETQPYYRVSLSTKWQYGVAYIGLALFLALSNAWLTKWLATIPYRMAA